VQDPTSPFADGTGPDPRELGLRVRALRLALAPSGMALGERLATCAPAAPCPLLWQGWSFPESGGTWTDGTEAVIRVPPVDAPSEEVELILDFSDVNFHGPDAHRRVEVTVDGEPSLCWWFTQPLEQYRSLPLPVSRDWTTIVLSIPWVASPRSLGISADERQLGLKLSALRVLSRRPEFEIATRGRARRRWRSRQTARDEAVSPTDARQP